MAQQCKDARVSLAGSVGPWPLTSLVEGAVAADANCIKVMLNLIIPRRQHVMEGASPSPAERRQIGTCCALPPLLAAPLLACWRSRGIACASVDQLTAAHGPAFLREPARKAAGAGAARLVPPAALMLRASTTVAITVALRRSVHGGAAAWAALHLRDTVEAAVS